MRQGNFREGGREPITEMFNVHIYKTPVLPVHGMRGYSRRISRLFDIHKSVKIIKTVHRLLL